MKAVLASGILIIFIFGRAALVRDTDFTSTPLWSSSQPDICKPGPRGRVEWIIHVRDSEYGWRENTHRANIALAVNDYSGEDDEMNKMALQLEVELTRALFRSNTNPIYDTDLALYIHALLATKKNPRDFHGTDLVADLLRRVESAPGSVNPYLVLALCNSHVLKEEHLEKIRAIADFTHSDADSREAQFKALALKAFACAAEMNPRLNKYHSEKEAITNCLNRKYNKTDGSFGNVYTTSLAVQAFTAGGDRLDWWDERKSRAYLEKESEIDVNLVKAYYIEMGLNAHKYKFIKDLYDGVPLPRSDPVVPDMHYVQYTIKKNNMPDVFLSLTLKVESGTNFYEIMERASNVAAEFKFTSYHNNNREPMIYSVSGIPNDVEENMFWRLCRNRREVTETFDGSPARLIPEKDEHLMYLYSNTDCPT